MKIQCMIVDDEPHAISVLESHVRQVPHLEMAASCRNAIEAHKLLRKKRIDLIFLDIKMPVISGIEFLRSLPYPPKIIFTTAYRDYAIEGFELDVVDYLLKPVSFDRFLRAVTKVNRQVSPSFTNDSQENKSLHATNKEAFIYFKADRSMRKVLIADILYVESSKDYARLYLTNNQPFLVRQSIGSLENILSAHRFVRIHRSFIVAIHRIHSFTTMQVVSGDKILPIGRLYRKQVMQVLHDAGV